jgi:glycosyltransferase involved in cell wall biosynthesis
MRVALIADCYVPMRSSAAIMLEDLAIELKAQEHEPIVIIPDANIDKSISISVESELKVIRVKTFNTKDVGYIKRTMAEIMMPFVMLMKLKNNYSLSLDLDGIIWYSPSIFHGPLIRALKKANKCKSYLILRDIFPEWALNTGLLKKRFPYYFFKLIESSQYKIADKIGIQSPSNENYFKHKMPKSHHKVEVLHNWISQPDKFACSISINKTFLAGRKIFVYAGNMGVAQGMNGIMDVIKKLDAERTDIGFLFIGRGSEVKRYQKEVLTLGLQNILVKDEIPASEIPELYAQCDFGLVFLDPRHQTHNIPGKFISYMKNGLPVIACINKGNDLFELIQKNNVGYVFEDIPCNEVINGITDMVDNTSQMTLQRNQCINLASSLFSSKAAVEQITKSLNNESTSE